MDSKHIFISYRRSDSQYMVDDLYKQLLHYQVPKDKIFKDVESIHVGTEFDVAIDEALAQADIVLLIIGNNWFSEENKKRLHQPDDFVRREVAKALQLKDTVVVPVLFDAPMPPANELPDDLKDVTRRNAFAISRKYKDADIKELLEKLEIGAFALSAAAQKPKKKKLIAAIMGVALAVLLAVAGFYLAGRSNKGEKEAARQAKHEQPATTTEDNEQQNQNPGKRETTAPRMVYDHIDAATEWTDDNKVYLFSGHSYIRYDLARDAIDDEYPAAIDKYWPGVTMQPQVDALMLWPKYNGAYFFKGAQYDKWWLKENRYAGGDFPRPIADSWQGLFAADIDACLVWKQGQVAYFFKGNQFVAYNMEQEQVASGFPMAIADYWQGLPWQQGIDAAFALNGNKAVLFHGQEYVIYDLQARQPVSEVRPLAGFTVQ